MFLHLNAMKTCSVDATLVPFLFFAREAGKFSVIHQDSLVTDTLHLKKIYFLKNILKQIDDVYIANQYTVIKELKKALQTSER